ncbi:hypothetical protein [Kordiimonas lacus]|uniref:Outer membrane lipoprotein-sorting protein n=1 Tax=Kordiimonas lacus TaxID=637679 RepID=A0A1G7EH41_9PROT|nr:hypothetical protein [Kordiimonas lacus]SDE63009.1 hypothetical protein SAMN04488071_3446 [Kordiimonas lacus]
MLKKATVSVLCLAACLTASAKAEEKNASLPLAKLFHKYDTYLKMASKEEPAFKPLYRVFPREGEAGVLEMSFTHNGKSVTFSTDEKGYIDYRPSQELLEANPVVTVDRPQNSMSLALTLGVLEPASTSYDMRALHDKVHTAWGQAKGLGGFMSILAPKHSNITANFGESCPTVTWSIKAQGKQIAGGSATGSVLIEFKDKVIRKADTLTFSCTPEQLML